MRESDIEKQYVAYAASKNCKAKKLSEVNRRGFPDRSIFCPGGRIFFIEFKRPGVTELRAAQVERIDELKRLGFSVYVCDSLDAAKRILDTELEIAGRR